MKRLYLFLTLSVLTICIQAQNNSWKNLRDQAEDAEKAKNYRMAADLFEQAWQQKKSKEELIYNAGNNYYKAKLFEKAIAALQNVKEQVKDYPMSGLMYARALKQMGKYAEATKEFVYYNTAYRGKDKDVITSIVQNEVKGCELGERLSNEKTDVEVTRLNAQINTSADEYAALPFNDDILYLTVGDASNSKFVRTIRQNGVWSSPQLPENFPTIPNKYYGDGCFAPDMKRFYFTICDGPSVNDIFNSRCELYAIRKSDIGWGTPEKLREYINTKDATHLQPYVVHEGNSEIIYYTSSKAGGKGGMDIWYIARDLSTDEMDFTVPKNCGSSVNTMGDEVTPFYSVKDRALYFSSNGMPTVGGFDIFKSDGNKSQFVVSENMGLPLNSSMDDLYYIQSNNSYFGFLTSNRTDAGKSETDMDLFLFGIALKVDETITVSGNLAEPNGNKLKDIEVKLYELTDEGQKKLLVSQMFSDTYSLPILQDKRYVLEADRPGLPSQVVEFNTQSGGSVKKDILMSGNVLETAVTNTTPTSEKPISKPEVVTTPAKIETTIPTTTKPTDSNPSIEEVKRTTTPSKPTEVVTNPTSTTKPTTAAPKPKVEETNSNDAWNDTSWNTATDTKNNSTTNSKPIDYKTEPAKTQSSVSKPASGDYFKIQIAAVRTYLTNHPNYKCILKRQLGDLDTEFYTERELTRVMVNGNFSESDAKHLLPRVKKCGFPSAFIVKYSDGTRVPYIN